jgi:crossover junction endodeoxyribonuclease RuvC
MSAVVVGLDLSLTATGVVDASGRAQTVPGKLPAKASALAQAQRLVRIRDAVLAACAGAELVVIEGYAYGRAQQAHQLGELGGVIRVALTDAGIRWVEVSPAQVKQYATGKGNASKDAMIIAAVKAGADITTNDQADAWWLRSIGLHVVTGTAPVAQRTTRAAVAGAVRSAVTATYGGVR